MSETAQFVTPRRLSVEHFESLLNTIDAEAKGDEPNSQDEKDDSPQFDIPLISASSLKLDPQTAKLLGSGKFGRVYKAIHTNSDSEKQTVAVKTYSKESVFWDEWRVIEHIYNTRTKQAADSGSSSTSTSASDQHDAFANILQVIGIYKDNCMVFEYIEGGSGDQLLYFSKDSNIRSQLRVSDVVNALIDTCQGMKTLHKLKITHRDLSLRNLLFQKTPNFASNSKDQQQQHSKRFNVKICDFGEAALDKNKVEIRRGPYLWLAPESIREQACNEQTDIYSFGILIYEMLVGIKPMSQTSIECAVVEILCLSMRGNINVFKDLIPVPLLLLVQVCWQQTPQNRYGNFDEILDQLQRIRNGLDRARGTNRLINARLDKIVFDKKQSKEMVKDLKQLYDLYLKDCNDIDNDEARHGYMTHWLLNKIFACGFDAAKDVDAIGFYVQNFPWGQEKTTKDKKESAKKVIKLAGEYGTSLHWRIDY